MAVDQCLESHVAQQERRAARVDSISQQRSMDSHGDGSALTCQFDCSHYLSKDCSKL